MNILLSSVEGNIARLTLNRPDKRNALNSDLLRALRTEFVSLKTDASIKVIILEANGKAFCAGADLAYLQDVSTFSAMENLADSQLLQETFHEIYTSPKPVIAKVHGAAIAGGCGLASVCDIVIAAERGAKFGYSEVKIGFIPAVVMVYLLRKIGDTKARRLLLSAEVISSKEAEQLGLITYCVDDELLDNFTNTIANTLSGNSASSMALVKEMMVNLQGMSLETGLRYAASMNAFTRMTDDCKAGIATFLNQ
ncbi:MAG: enoyl-CoA hydratase/isomerase family protein [Bacteroidetes bacterium]|nr:enoyl-CoA hydratase/isomerase family protein [Bacteroidota bacterium]